MMYWNRIFWVAMGLMAVAACVLVVSLMFGGGNSNSPSNSAEVGRPAASLAVDVQPTPCVPPPGFSRCPDTKETRPKAQLDQPSFGGVANALKPQMAATPTATPKPGGGFQDVPIIGAPVALVTGIIGAIDWLIRNLWLILVILIGMTFIFPNLSIAKLFRALWHLITIPFNRKGRQRQDEGTSVGDWWKNHGDNFTLPKKKVLQKEEPTEPRRPDQSQGQNRPVRRDRGPRNSGRQE